MTHQELQAVANALAETLAAMHQGSEASIDAAIARINAACVLRRAKLRRERTIAFTAKKESRHASTLGMLGDSAVRQRLIAAGVLS